MPDTNFDPFETVQSGFDDFKGEVIDALAEPDTQIDSSGETLYVKFTVQLDEPIGDTTDTTVALSAGKKVDSQDGVNIVGEDGNPRPIDSNTRYGDLINRAFAPTYLDHADQERPGFGLREHWVENGMSPLNVEHWVGYRMHFVRHKKNYGGEIGVQSPVFVDAVLSGPGVEGDDAPRKPAKKAPAKKQAAKKAAPRRKAAAPKALTLEQVQTAVLAEIEGWGDEWPDAANEFDGFVAMLLPLAAGSTEGEAWIADETDGPWGAYTEEEGEEG